MPFRVDRRNQADVTGVDGAVLLDDHVRRGRVVAGRPGGDGLIPDRHDVNDESAAGIRLSGIEGAYRNQGTGDRLVGHGVEHAAAYRTIILHANDIWRRRAAIAKCEKHEHSKYGKTHTSIIGASAR